ncbi:phosphotransferase enzyme family protein [Kribbella turkmenica]|uniref:phosphotransferase enzyme family protein n=1 Tax=Kribbella turkmenica TaxID=2530375 RepID=UPI001404558B|nr:aminoglycoside phosphotransferase family protein [Kribbella turkmenica]
MYIPTAQVVAAAFDLGKPVGGLLLIRRGDTDTWRLETTSGRYFVKGYWPTTGGQFTSGGLVEQLAVAMPFEQRAMAAGVDLADPVPPVEPELGWVTRIHDRLFRVYDWIEGRTVRPEDDITEWLGRTMAIVHQLQPVGEVGLPDWWRTALRPRADWDEWFTEARRRGEPWSEVAWERLPRIVELTARIEQLGEVAPDRVMTHGDFKSHNILMTANGPVLIDWDSVRSDSAAMEAGRIAEMFGGRTLEAYVGAGGDVRWAGEDLYLGVARAELQRIYERVLVLLDRMPAPRWMGTRDEVIEQLRESFDRLGQWRGCP